MKTKHSISGIYFRVLNDETNKYDNVTFEDLTELQQDEILNDRNIEWIKSLAKTLANKLYDISEQFDIFIDK